MNPNSTPDFIPDDKMPDFISDGDMGKMDQPANPGRTDLLTGHPIINYLLGQAGNVEKDMVQGVTARGTGKTTKQMETQAQDLEKRYAKEKNPARAREIYDQLQSIRSGISNIAQDTASNFSPDVQQNPLWRGAKAGTQVATTAEALAGPLSFLLGKAGVANPVIGQLPDGLANMPLLGQSGKLVQGSGIAKAGLNHALHGAAGGALYSLGQQKEKFDPKTTGEYAATGAVLEPLIAAITSVGGKLTEKQLYDKVAKAKDAAATRGEFGSETKFNQQIKDELDRVDPHGINTELRKAVQAKVNSLPSLLEGGTGSDALPGAVQNLEAPASNPMIGGESDFEGIPSQARSIVRDASELAKDKAGAFKVPAGKVNLPTDIADIESAIPSDATATGAKYTEMPVSGDESGIVEKKLSPDWFHSLRKQLDDQINWARKANSPIEEDAAKLIRRVASDNLHTMAPETAELDKWIAAYHNPIIQKMGVGPFSVNYPKSLSGIPSATINATLAAILGGGIAKRIGL